MIKRPIDQRSSVQMATLVRLAGAVVVLSGCPSSVDPSMQDTAGAVDASRTDGGSRPDVAPTDSSAGDSGGTMDSGPGMDGAAGSCRTAADCGVAGQLCVFDTPACDPSARGRCALPTPCAEPRIYCACDNATTFRACQADRPYAREGACAAGDGGTGTSCSPTRACAGGLICQYTPGCGMPSGRCVPPTDCAMIRTYCGCDGREFMDCPGNRGTQPYAHEGPCATGDGGTGSSCRTSSECARGDVCVFEAGCPRDPPARTGRCQGAMECLVPVPFCGCDGMTFSDCPGTPTQPWSARGACGGAAVSCDPASVTCRSLPPVCVAGEVPSVVGMCWGPCVPFARCGPIPCRSSGATCPVGLRCDPGSATCRP